MNVPRAVGRVELYRSGLIRKEWRFRVRALNGHVLVASGDGYKRKIDALNTAERLFPTMEIREL
jgi:uncharacterized protein YegP (UPF0339 family)